MKRQFEPVKLRRTFWHGPEPVYGDVLRTSTGRQYLILKVHGKTLHCLVDDPSQPVSGRIFTWQWNKR